MDSFPRQQARTQRFSLGAPRTFTVSRDGGRVLFLRSPAGDDPVTALWELDVAAGIERLVADPAALGRTDSHGQTAPAGAETDEERSRRERRRERAAGIVAYDADAACARVVFALAGECWVADVAAGTAQPLALTGPVFDPRIDPSGERVAWCSGRGLRVAHIDGTDDRLLAGEVDPEVTWGQAEFVIAEETDRDRGFWWAPDGRGLLAARVDNTPVQTWWIADPAHPERTPVAHRYPAAGTANAAVSLWYLDLAGGRTEIGWDRDELPYLSAVRWDDAGGPLLVVEARNHKACQVLGADVGDGATTVLARAADRAWVGWPHGVPRRLDDSRLVWFALDDDTTSLTVEGRVVTPPGLQVRAVVGAGSEVVFTASSEPTEIDLYRWADAGVKKLAGGGVVVAAAAAGPTVVTSRRVLNRPGVACTVTQDGKPMATIGSNAETPVLTATVRLLHTGPAGIRTGVVLPREHQAGVPLPVLVFPYGGPGAQMVLADQHTWLEAQWRADQGFAVVVADGRGTPGRTPSWERTVYQDFATGVLEDQVTALREAADAVPEIDLTRVGICGWSFGGYLAALAVLRRPDVFHAAVAGAPVTDWRLYDTYYTEKYLGHPDDGPGVYDRCSLLGDAAGLSRPLLLVHGLVDDNVVAAHTLRLSQRLLEAGRPHAVIPLSGVTHMASAEDVAENLLLLQMDFLRRALGQPAGDQPSRGA